MSTMDKTPQDDFDPPTPSATGDTGSLGAWFAQIRSETGAEQRDVARHLGLNPLLIAAIEGDDFARLGPPVFARGYLSRYARLLHMPEDAVLERYRTQVGIVEGPPPLQVLHPLQRQTHARDLRGLLYLILVIALGWTAVQNLDALDPRRLTSLWNSSPTGDTPATAPATTRPTSTGHSQTYYPFQTDSGETAVNTPAAPVPVTPVAPGGPPASSTPPPVVTTLTPAAPNTEPPPPILDVPPVTAVPDAPPPSVPGIDTASASASAAASAEAPPPAAESAAPPPAPPVSLPGETRLAMEFSGDCWVEVKDAQGKILLNGLMKARSSQTVSGTPPFSVTLGNAPAARLTLGEKPVDTTVYVPRRGTVSRFTLDQSPL